MEAIWVEIRKIPIVTRSLIGLTLSVTGPVALGFVNPYYILFSTRHILQKFEVWRLITPFFFAGNSALQVLFDLFLLYRNSTVLEEQKFFNRSVDYLWMMICLMISIILTNFPIRSMVFWGPYLTAIGYLWSQVNPDSLVSLFGLPPFKAAYYPFAMLALDFVRGGKPLAIQSVSGLLAGYLIHYAYDIYPSTNRSQRFWLFYPPGFLVRLLGGNQQTAGSGARGGQRLGGASARVWGGQGPSRLVPGARSDQPAQQATSRHSWGTGNRLG